MLFINNDSSKGTTAFISLNKIPKFKNCDKFYCFVYPPLLWNEIMRRMENYKHDADII